MIHNNADVDAPLGEGISRVLGEYRKGVAATIEASVASFG